MNLYPSLFLFISCIFCPIGASKNAKRGLAYAESETSDDIKKANGTSSVISWQYNWGAAPPDYLAKSGIQYIPMQWGSSGIENFTATVERQGARIIFGFNEPDFASQSNINATYAATLWKKYIDPLSESGIRLGAPAVTNAPSGRPWLAAFLAACSGCKIDFIPFHWYGIGVENFYDYIWEMHEQFPNWPLWVTEYACTSSDLLEVADFLNASIHYMDTLDWIEGYSWFAFFRKDSGSYYNLLDQDGTLNNLGKIYIDG